MFINRIWRCFNASLMLATVIFFSLCKERKMSASIAQNLQIGSQGMLITGDGITPFKGTIQRPLPFAVEPRVQNPDSGTIDYGQTISKTFQYDADLVLRCFLLFHIKETAIESGTTVSAHGASRIQQTEDLGHAMIKSMSFKIGSVTHQTWTGDMIHVKQSLSMENEQMHEEMTGRTTDGAGHTNTLQERPYQKQSFWVEVPAWFAPVVYSGKHAKNKYGNALQLVACQLSEPKLEITLRAKSLLFKHCNDGLTTGLPKISDTDVCKLEAVKFCFEYCFLDDTTRDTFSQIDHYHLILQYQNFHELASAGAQTLKYRPQFNHIVRDIIWYFRSTDNENALEWYNFAGGETSSDNYGVFNGDFFTTCSMKYNGNVRVEALPPQYYRMVQPRQNYHRIPNEFIYCYSFSLNPEDDVNSPAGGINMSRIDNFELVFECTTAGIPSDGEVYIWAFNYNLVMIKAGTAHLSFAS